MFQMPFEHLQGLGFHHYHRQAFPVLSHPQSQKVFPDVQSEPPVFQFLLCLNDLLACPNDIQPLLSRDPWLHLFYLSTLALTSALILKFYLKICCWVYKLGKKAKYQMLLLNAWTSSNSSKKSKKQTKKTLHLTPSWAWKYFTQNLFICNLGIPFRIIKRNILNHFNCW